MTRISLSLLMLFSCSIHEINAISCKTENNTDIPTWTIMKMPKGTQYYYYDDITGFNLSPFSLNDTENGAMTYTLQQLWSQTTEYIIYNDEPPSQTEYNFSVAHSKGVIMWDTISAVIVSHSIPKFPRGPKETNTYEALMENAWDYGQHAICFEIPFTSLSSILQLLYNTTPSIYEENCQICHNMNIQYKYILTDSCSMHIDGNYMVFMKPSSLNVDIWTSCISSYFMSDIRVESWIHDKVDGAYCPPTYPYKTLDIGELQFPDGYSFSEYSDHSKWGILDSPAVCMGDLNRAVTQKERSGMVYCWKNAELWSNLNGLIKNTNSC
jgi:hypothetical protein